MDWTLRVDVPKGEAIVVFINNGGRDFFRDNFVENSRGVACGSSDWGKEGLGNRGQGTGYLITRAGQKEK